MSPSAAPTVEADPTPSPAPTSEVQLSARERTSQLLQADLAPPDPARDAAYRDAEALYADDPLASLRALAAGTHPLQRAELCSPEGRAESMRSAAEGLARGVGADDE